MTSSPDQVTRRPAPPPFWASLLLCSLVTAAFGYLRLYVFHDRIFPLSSSLPLLLCLWNRDLRLLYGMSLAFSAMTLAKVFMVSPDTRASTFDSFTITSQLLNIWVVAAAIHRVIRLTSRLRNKRAQLEKLNSELGSSNKELSVSNEELAAREEEISRQNEELQSQTEELEQQAEELRQQAEEMEQQSADLHETNAELSRREKGMQTLLESGRWLRSDQDEKSVMNGICQAALQILGGEVHAAAVVDSDHGVTRLQGDAGFGLNGAVSSDYPFEQSFAYLVLERGETAYLEDVLERSDLQLPRPATGRPLRSVLGTPIWLEGKPVAVLVMYSRDPRNWTQQEFQIAEWLAAQAALTLHALRFQQELEVKRHEAEEASVQKTRFLAAVSHDVRTPANAIGLLSELIERMAVDPEKVKQVPALARSLSDNARALIDLVSDVLDLAKFDSGQVDLQISDFPLSSLVQAEVSQAEPAATKKGLHLSSSLPEQEVWLRTDRMKLARILSNLLGNAVKFTEAGQVVLAGEATADGFELRVTDTGVGIPDNQLPHIFDEFYQLRNPERDREKGAGLGLAICTRLLDSLGCKVTVSSKLNVGTTFAVLLPHALLTPGDEVPRSAGQTDEGAAVSSASPLAGLNILLVEDHHVTRRAMAQLLAAEGAVVSEARTGKEALHFLSHGLHDVMLLDLNLPDIDGSEVLKSLKTNRPARLKRVLAVSGDVRPERVEEVKLLGADNLIPKPLSIERILEGIEGAEAAR
ncbi:MAG: hypothetical protein JWO82_1407 [Akkermansiaceae bacterium]|nr:hypothetical protein [Akkermansiaceae bacterium]